MTPETAPLQNNLPSRGQGGSPQAQSLLGPPPAEPASQSPSRISPEILDRGHPDWNEISEAVMAQLKLDLERQDLVPGNPEYDDAVKHTVRDLEKRLCRQTPQDRLTMLNGAERAG
jgi:hypothetical protein